MRSYLELFSFLFLFVQIFVVIFLGFSIRKNRIITKNIVNEIEKETENFNSKLSGLNKDKNQS